MKLFIAACLLAVSLAQTGVSGDPYAANPDELVNKDVKLLGDRIGEVIKVPMEAEILSSGLTWPESPHKIEDTVYWSSVKDRNAEGLSVGNLYAIDLETYNIEIVIPESGIFGGEDGVQITSLHTGNGMIPVSATGAQAHTTDWVELGSNGMYPYEDPQGVKWLILAQHGAQRLVKIPMQKIIHDSVIPEDVVVLADKYMGVSLNSPNDMQVVGDKLFFTDPPFGLIRVDPPFDTIHIAAPQPASNVFILDLISGDLESIVQFPTGDVTGTLPNGIGVYGDKLYVALSRPTASWMIYEKDTNNVWNQVHQWNLVEMGGTPPETTSLDVFCDGISISGHYLYGSCTGGVYIFDLDMPYEEAFVGQIYINDFNTNNYVGENSEYIYLTANTNVLRVKLADPEPEMESDLDSDVDQGERGMTMAEHLEYLQIVFYIIAFIILALCCIEFPQLFQCCSYEQKSKKQHENDFDPRMEMTDATSGQAPWLFPNQPAELRITSIDSIIR